MAFDPRNPSGTPRTETRITSTTTPVDANNSVVADPRNPSGRKSGPDLRNPSGKLKELPRRTSDAPLVSVAFDPRNPSGRTTPIKIRPILVNDQKNILTAKIANYNLFINYYIDKSQDRQNELNKCVLENIENFDNVVVISTASDFDTLKSLVKSDNKSDKKLISVISESRATFSEYFELTSVFNDLGNINIISNIDIVIDKETLINCIPYFNSDVKRVLALTRWNIKPDGSSEFFNRADSQDVWIFNGPVEKGILADFYLGKPGCDNALAERLDSAGYEVINPSLSLKVYHHHLVPLRNYLNAKGKQIERGVTPPYKILIPTI